MEILCFYAGIAFYYLKSLYPLLFLWIVFFFRFKIVYFGWFSAAVLLSMLHQTYLADSSIADNKMVLKDIKLSGYVVSLPQKTAQKLQFQFYATQIQDTKAALNLLLSCYEACPDIKAGEHWQLNANIKKPINLANPGGFDYVSWLGSRHTEWIGNVRSNSLHQLTSNKHFPLLKLRERLAESLSQLVPNENLLGIFQALTIGVTLHVDKNQWELFRRTGTTHLIDISGEHIALVAGFVFLIVKWIWTLCGKVCLWYPAQKIASIVAVLITLFYSIIAGFSVPTQRAVLMSFFFLLRNVAPARFSTWQAWRYALFTVLIFEPHSVLMMGFYFSFLAVAILILIHQKIPKGKLKKLMLMQLACLIGLMPLSIYWFSYASINGLVANFIVIPWVGLIIVPLALMIALFCSWFVVPGSIAFLTWNLTKLLEVLQWIDSYSAINLRFTFTSIIAPLALMGVTSMFLFLPYRKFGPVLGAIAFGSVFPRYDTVRQGHASIDVLDVGQGLAIVVRTTHHALIYDTGMKFYHSTDMGKLAIIPYLNAVGLKALDKVVISHPDLDHRGGLRSVEEQFPVLELIVNNPSFYKRGISCHNGSSWTWDGITFQFFPLLNNLRGQNNNSCVLKISSSHNQILLTGDIEKAAEEYLVTTYGNQLKSTLLLVPHHGSKTSSSQKFIEQVAPRYALVSYGFNNRYHFPHQQALMNYQLHHIPVYNTLGCGMIRIDLGEMTVLPKCYVSDNFG
jgi:competence protein ComEC